MKKIKFLTMSLLALLMACFTACENKYNVDHTAELVGTWTCLTNGYAEALVIKADGSVLSTGYDGEDYWENVAGTIKIKDNVATMTFEDGDNAIGHIDVVPGIAFSIYEEDGEDWTFNYCANDLADEVVGMWVCNDGLAEEENDMVIMSYSTEGKVTMTTPASTFVPTDFVNQVFDYKVVGDLLFKMFPKENLSEGANPYLASRLTYSPNGTSLGDVLIENQHTPTENGVMELTFSFLRVKETLDLAGKGYYYHDVFVSNVDGVDQDIDFMGYTFNFAKMTDSELNKLLNSLLFNVEFPDANNIQYIYMYNNAKEVLEAPIAVEGNKLTVEMSANEPALKDVVFYAFQDADNSQLHLYMHRDAFVNFHANMQVKLMAAAGQLDLNDAAAVKAVYDNIDAAVNTINVSLVFKAK